MLQSTCVRFVHRDLLLLDFSVFLLVLLASYLVASAEGVFFKQDLQNGQHTEKQRLLLYMQCAAW